jgi:signal transduction histidine kinase
MSPLTLDQSQLETLGQLLAAGGHHDVADLLRSSLARLVAFWPAQAGALLYHSPKGEVVRLEHGQLNNEARTMIEQARTSFARRDDSGEPAIGYYSLEGGYDLLELPLQSNEQGVGLLHLVVTADTSEKSGSITPLKPDEDLLILLVRSMGGEADKLAMLQQAERDLREIRMLYEFGQSLAISVDMSSLVNHIARRAPEIAGAERCLLFILDDEQHELVLELPGQEREFRMPQDRGIAGWVATHGIPQIVNDVEQDSRWYDVISRETDFSSRSLVCVPIRFQDHIVGVIQLLNKRGGDAFTDQDVQLLTTLAAQVGIAIANARTYRKLKDERDQLLAREAQVRRAIARELHSGPTQRLNAVMMNIEFIKQLLVAMPERVAGEMETLSELVSRTISDIRTFLFELRPLGLETQGLLAAMQQYIASWHDPEDPFRDIRLRLQAPANIPRLSPDVEAAIFIIIQEAVNNARQHSGAPEVIIYLYVEEVHLVASVRDRGKGFNVAWVEAHYQEQGHMGLASMKRRAEQIDADLRIRSEPGNGTMVELRVPLAS